MGNESFEGLSLDQIEERLNSLESDKMALKKALEQKRQQGKHDLAQEIRDMIGSRGYDVEEIMGLVAPRRRSVTRAKSNRSYTRYADPQNTSNVYIRGVLPGWMKDQMAEKGLNPKNKDDREKFKEEFLVKLDG